MIACLLITLTQILPFAMSSKYSLDSFPQTCLVFSQLCLNKWSTKCPGIMSDSCPSVPPHPIHQQALLALSPKYITSVCLCPSPRHFWSKPRLLAPDYITFVTDLVSASTLGSSMYILTPSQTLHTSQSELLKL